MASIRISKIYVDSDVQYRLLTSAQKGEIGTVTKLLRLKVNPNIRDEQHVTPLAKACSGGHAEIARLLIEAGADIEAIMPNNVTALHLAARGDHSETIKHLVLAGAKLDVRTRSGVEPIDLTKYNSISREILSDAKRGDMPELEEFIELPEIPGHAIPDGSKKKASKGKKKGGKGKKKGGKKKGGGKKKKKKK
ncbi:hypothetical protein ScPMuIL_010383 [Solemya velum]